MARRPSTPEQRMLGAIVAVLVGFGLGAWGLWELWEAWSCRSWPAAEGQVTSSRMVSYRSKGRTKYRGEVTYQYPAAGAAYYGSRWSTFDGHAPRSAVDEHPTGSAVTVYFDPAQPSYAVLSRDAGSGPWWILLAGVVVAFFGIHGYSGAAAEAGLGGAVNTGKLYRTRRKEFQPDSFLK